MEKTPTQPSATPETTRASRTRDRWALVAAFVEDFVRITFIRVASFLLISWSLWVVPIDAYRHLHREVSEPLVHYARLHRLSPEAGTILWFAASLLFIWLHRFMADLLNYGPRSLEARGFVRSDTGWVGKLVRNLPGGRFVFLPVRLGEGSRTRPPWRSWWAPLIIGHLSLELDVVITAAVSRP